MDELALLDWQVLLFITQLCLTLYHTCSNSYRNRQIKLNYKSTEEASAKFR